LASECVSAIGARVGLRRCELLNDRRHALTVDDDRTVRLWDLTRAREIASLGRSLPFEGAACDALSEVL
jgi:hypothetical protein